MRQLDKKYHPAGKAMLSLPGIHSSGISVFRRILDPAALAAYKVALDKPILPQAAKELTMGIGMQEMLIILLVVLVLFGAKKLPEIGGGLGRAIRNFRKAQEEPDEIDISAKKAEPAPQQEAPRSVASEEVKQEVKSETKQAV